MKNEISTILLEPEVGKNRVEEWEEVTYRFCLEALARTTLVRNDLLEGISLYEEETRERARSVGQSRADGNGRAVIVRRAVWFVDWFVQAAFQRLSSSGNARG